MHEQGACLGEHATRALEDLGRALLERAVAQEAPDDPLPTLDRRSDRRDVREGALQAAVRVVERLHEPPRLLQDRSEVLERPL